MATNSASAKSKGGQTREIGVQTELQSMNYLPPRILSGMQLDESAYPSFFAKPHMVFLLLGIISLVTYSALEYSEGYNSESFIHNSRKYCFVK
jgi:hypothetical protein